MRQRHSIKQPKQFSGVRYPNTAGLAIDAGDFARPRLIGYARVSTEDQNLDMQISMLADAGVDIKEDLFADKLSATNAKRPAYHLMRKQIQRGDTLIVYSTSRLARDLEMLRRIVRELDEEGISLRSLTEPHLNTKTATGKLMFNIQGAFDQFERDKIAERTRDGMAECRRKGMYLGAPLKVTPAVKKKIKTMRMLNIPVSVISSQLKLSTSAIYNALR